MKQLKTPIKFFLYVFLIILSCHGSYAIEKNKSAKIQVKNFFENLKTLEADFIQVSPSGNVSNGKVYFDLPGKLRIDYENPDNLLITCKGFWIVIQDREAKTSNNIPVKNSPFAPLLQNTSFLNNQNIKKEYTIEAGIISLKLKSQNNDDHESLVLEFSENPFSLKKWVIQDS